MDSFVCLFCLRFTFSLLQTTVKELLKRAALTPWAPGCMNFFKVFKITGWCNVPACIILIGFFLASLEDISEFNMILWQTTWAICVFFLVACWTATVCLQWDHKMVLEKKKYFSFSLTNCREACSGMTSETCSSSATFSTAAFNN